MHERGKCARTEELAKKITINLQCLRFLSSGFAFSNHLVENASSSTPRQLWSYIVHHRFCLPSFCQFLYQFRSSLLLLLNSPWLVSKALCTVIWRACRLVRLETAGTLPAIVVEVVDDSTEEYAADLIDGEVSRRSCRGRCG